MAQIDWDYLLNNASSLCGVPAFWYERGSLKKSFFSSFAVPPLRLVEEGILRSSQQLGYRFDSYSFYYVFFKAKESVFFFGPCREGRCSKEELRQFAFSQGVKPADLPDFSSALQGVQTIPLLTLILSCCSLYHVFSGDKADPASLFPSLFGRTPEKEGKMAPEELIVKPHSSSYQAEQAILTFVRNGDLEKLKSWISSIPSFKAGETSSLAKTQAKNIFVVTASLASREAIKAGLDVDLALSISDLYLKRADAFSETDGLLSLQAEMLLDYTERVHLLSGERGGTANLLSNYAERHIGENFSLKKVASDLSMSPSSLCAKLKKENGSGVVSFLKRKKLEKAKMLLEQGKGSVSEVSFYLGYSTPALFSRCFKQEFGYPPKEASKISTEKFSKPANIKKRTAGDEI